MNLEQPLVLGLAGEAATGKTVTGEALAPIGRIIDLDCKCSHKKSEHDHKSDEQDCLLCDCRGYNLSGQIVWNHIFFALPIYRVASARQKIKGERAYDRQLFEIHEALLDLFGRSPLFSAIKSYDELVELVKYVAGMDCEPVGKKARSFMQKFGELCREYDEDVFARWALRKVDEEHRQFLTEFPTHQYPGLSFGSAISDVRFPNEAHHIKSHPNGLLIRLKAHPEVLRQRLIDRDGQALTPEQAAHVSENSLSLIPEEDFDAVLDTSEMTVSQQVSAVRELVNKMVFAHA